MIFLTSTSDKLQITTSAAGAVDLHASYIDSSSSTITPGRTNISGVATATTTDLITSPASGTRRKIEYISIYNVSTTVYNTIDIQITDDANVVTLWSGTLSPGRSIQYANNQFERFTSGGASVFDVTNNVPDIQDFTTAGTATWVKPTPRFKK